MTTKLNMNRDVPLAEPSAELQRLRTHNKLVLDTLRELYDVQVDVREKPLHHVAWHDAMKRCKKVLA